MSTFDGLVHEFPFIQIDYFRKSPDRPAPLACFLSHVHSDHLQGLESFRAPFIYCSPATRELLLRIEKYPHRLNFSRGVLESRRLHYKHLSRLLKPIPLNTATVIELTPRSSIRVTLFDANHCTGAVMFLIEGDGKAILYTGDIRAEFWWVNSLVRNPILLPYTLGSKRLDKIYLDTTFARASSIYRTFPSKAEGLAELLQKVASYPDDTIFYFRAWTFGYEEVWIALSASLDSKIHVDRYQLGLYQSLRGIDAVTPALCGFELGNRLVPGCLSEEKHSRIHSCEPGVHCAAVPSPNTVYIFPIVNRTTDGTRIPEEGAGGGGGDLYQLHELELPDQSAVEQLEQLCREKITDTQLLSQTRQALNAAFHSKRRTLPLDPDGVKDDQDIPLEHLIHILTRGPKIANQPLPPSTLPKTIVRPPFIPNGSLLTHPASTFPTRATLHTPNCAPSSPPSPQKTSSPAPLTRSPGTRTSPCRPSSATCAPATPSPTTSTCARSSPQTRVFARANAAGPRPTHLNPPNPAGAVIPFCRDQPCPRQFSPRPTPLRSRWMSTSRSPCLRPPRTETRLSAKASVAHGTCFPHRVPTTSS
ncbi:beta-lactamase-like protein [Aspergillus ambiguus]|uniref:putative DNA repair protein n=1 Tax=Aspergillus ambiguus TaxID=176160 RepID=UPI003CCDB4A2